MIYGNGIINNSGKFISSDWITINGNPYLYNDGIIAAEKQILIYSPNVKDSKGMGAPHIFINGSDLMNPFHWVAVMDTMGIIHWELEVGSYIPAVGGFATLVDGALYAIEGNSEEAKAKLIELPIGLIGAKVEAKVIEKTGAKVEAKLLKGPSKARGNFTEKINTADIPNMSKNELIEKLPSDWKVKENNGFVHVRDAEGNIRMRIDPPDKVTNYDHVHLYDETGNPLDVNLNIVDRKSPDAHIPIEK